MNRTPDNQPGAGPPRTLQEIALLAGLVLWPLVAFGLYVRMLLTELRLIP